MANDESKTMNAGARAVADGMKRTTIDIPLTVWEGVPEIKEKGTHQKTVQSIVTRALATGTSVDEALAAAGVVNTGRVVSQHDMLESAINYILTGGTLVPSEPEALAFVQTLLAPFAPASNAKRAKAPQTAEAEAVGA